MARILLIDDSPVVRDSLHRLLEIHGAQVFSTGAYSVAVAALEDHTYDVVISDYDLGLSRTGADLLETAEALQPEAKRVLISGVDRAPGNAHAFINKLDVQDLLDEVLS